MVQLEVMEAVEVMMNFKELVGGMVEEEVDGVEMEVQEVQHTVFI